MAALTTASQFYFASPLRPMPILPPAPHKVLVTCANGYVAMWVIPVLLEQGYSVRGTMRSEEKTTRLQEYFEEYGARAEWVVVEI
ncbi:hypothetical protein B0H34DRAFT_205520 [Crassisporium funariophilum]|nr:hypothetical protein B0H34DRAFT_205520 [Crassisporium funariophilum]